MGAAVGETHRRCTNLINAHIEALELETVPEHLIVIGGGYIGLELSQTMRRLGSRVTIIERSATLLNREDPDVSAGMEALFHEEDIALILYANVEEVSGLSGEAITVTYRQMVSRAPSRARTCLSRPAEHPTPKASGSILPELT